jgi:hypothetical protein
MKYLSWNCRGLGNSSAVRAYKKLIRSFCPDLVFLIETKLLQSDPKAKSTLTCGPLSNFFMVDCNMHNGHRAGGLAIIWNCNVHVDILQFNKMFIDTYITACNSPFSWFSTGLYGSPYTNKKYLTYNATPSGPKYKQI